MRPHTIPQNGLFGFKPFKGAAPPPAGGGKLIGKAIAPNGFAAGAPDAPAAPP